MKKPKKSASVREVQHNFAQYLDYAKNTPVTITKYGEDTAVLVNPEKYNVIRKQKTRESVDLEGILNSGFIGMYKDREDWKGRDPVKIARELNEKSLHGK